MSKVFFALILLLLCIYGCEQPKQVSGLTGENEPNAVSVYAQYSPVKIDILPLTEFSISSDTNQGTINLFVSLLDSFGSQIKSPCIFRFELYMRVQRSSEPKGSRVMIWPDADLIDPKINNEYWRNFLRAYEFNLPFEPQTGQSYMLEVTCLCPNNKRITSEFILKIRNESL